MPSAEDTMIRAEQLRKHYQMGDSVVRALDGVDFSIKEGEFVAIVGASGSGKSTLMHLIGCLDRPTNGLLEINGALVGAMTEKQLATMRNTYIGFVFQTFNLINRTSAMDNVIVPLVYTRQAVHRATAKKALDRVGLLSRASHTPSEMSGGECQRVAIARAIVNSPRLLLADEPTGNLDSRTGEQIMQIFHELHAEGITVVLVTHEMDVAVQADRIISMKDGKIVEDSAVSEQQRAQLLIEVQDGFHKVFEPKASARAKVIAGRTVPNPEATS